MHPKNIIGRLTQRITKAGLTHNMVKSGFPLFVNLETITNHKQEKKTQLKLLLNEYLIKDLHQIGPLLPSSENKG